MTSVNNSHTKYEMDKREVLYERRNSDENMNCNEKVACALLNTGKKESTTVLNSATQTGLVFRDFTSVFPPFGKSSDLFEPVLAIHSNEFVQKKRDGLRNTAKTLNSKLVTSDRLTFTRPPWPFSPWAKHSWGSNLDPDVFLSVFDPTFDIGHKYENHPEPTILKNVLDVETENLNMEFVGLIFKESEASCAREKSIEYDRVVADIRNILSRTCEHMAGRHKIFKNYKIIEMGSMGEGTKIGEPDEFDVMIEIPSLCDAVDIHEDKNLRIKNDPNDETRKIKIRDRQIFSDLKDDQEEDEEKDEDFMRQLWNNVQVKIAEAMTSINLPGWKWLDTVPMYAAGIAQTQTLLWSGVKYQKLVVRIDICLCFQPDQFDSRIDWNQEILDKSRPGVTKADQQEKLFPLHTYMILKSNGDARWTRAVYEKAIWSAYSAESGRKKLYRCLKYFVLNFLPQKYNEDLFRFDPLIPSYWLKTLLYYQMTYFVDEKFWDDLRLRFVETCFLLRKCLKEKHLSSYFVPHNVLSKIVPLYSRSVGEDYTKVLENVNVVCNVLSEKSSGSKTEDSYTELAKNITKSNEEELEKGIYKSVIELCYRYAYNDFSEANFEALKSFIKTFAEDSFLIRGDGIGMKLFFNGVEVNIDEKISEFYDDNTEYFNSRPDLQKDQELKI